MATRQQPAEIEQDEVTRPTDLGFPAQQEVDHHGIPVHREVEVEAVNAPPATVDSSGYVEIRMAETIEEFTYGNPHHHHLLEKGKRYRVPREIAAYLWDLGKIYR